MTDVKDMHRCQGATCGYVYDPGRGDRKGKVERGTKFEDLPEDWRCPSCGCGKKLFECMDES